MKKNSTSRCRNCVIHLRGFIPQNTYNLRKQSPRKQKSKTLDIENKSDMENNQTIPLENKPKKQKSKILDATNENGIGNSQPIFLENNSKDGEIDYSNLYCTNDLFNVDDLDSFLTSFK